MKPKPVLSILEGKWFPRKHVSMKDLFLPLFTVWTPNADASIHYEMFNTKAAFSAAVKYAFQRNQASAIYIGAHGTVNGLAGFHEHISRDIIRKALDVPGAAMRGVYFGSCLFGSRKNAEYLFKDCARVEWIAGYTSSVEFIDSSALDLYFLRHYLFPTPGKGNREPATTREKVEYAFRRIRDDMGALARRLEFHVYLRNREKGRRAVDLMADAAG